jgi:hypothetical protein
VTFLNDDIVSRSGTVTNAGKYLFESMSQSGWWYSFHKSMNSGNFELQIFDDFEETLNAVPSNAYSGLTAHL